MTRSPASGGVSLGSSSWVMVAKEPFTRRSWRELLYTLVSFPLGVFGFAFVIATLFFGALYSVSRWGWWCLRHPPWRCVAWERSIGT